MKIEEFPQELQDWFASQAPDLQKALRDMTAMQSADAILAQAAQALSDESKGPLHVRRDALLAAITLVKAVLLRESLGGILKAIKGDNEMPPEFIILESYMVACDEVKKAVQVTRNLME